MCELTTKPVWSVRIGVEPVHLLSGIAGVDRLIKYKRLISASYSDSCWFWRSRRSRSMTLWFVRSSSLEDGKNTVVEQTTLHVVKRPSPKAVFDYDIAIYPVPRAWRLFVHRNPHPTPLGNAQAATRAMPPIELNPRIRRFYMGYANGDVLQAVPDVTGRT
ncbi:hypothetical protein NP493_711g03011 [Ridgeia piscesae]|uniref:Uncharacterized protein n=1 Tax=Ridgeia piscesae TaxID=27915 RepID=A0AAD9KRY5_RIDPI|nr:hypothetical protein NP493_711g03011 [Ridgeia piscesae]